MFESFYPGQAAMIPDYWMPNKTWPGCNVDDPSARVLSNYGASGVWRGGNVYFPGAQESTKGGEWKAENTSLRRLRMSINQKSTVEEQYRNPMNLNTRISIHEKYSVNHQGFGNWITSHYQIENGMRVLELGCGTGSMWAGKKELVSRCAELVLSDFSEGMLCQAQKTLSEIQGIVYRTIDIQHIPYEDQSFDAVIANMMLYHVPDLQKGLAEVKRVLKKGGTFYCATYGEQGIMAYISSLFDQYGITDSSNYSFTLQNGKSQLLTFFAEVRRYDYQDALAVTNLDDMADYIYSLAGMSKLQELPREILLSVLSKHTQNGILYVPKEYGMFISK